MRSSQRPEATINCTNLAQRVKDRIEVHENFSLGNFGNIVQALACKVSYAAFLIAKASEQGIDELLHVRRDFETQCNGCCRQANETSIATVKWLLGRGK